MKAEHIIKLAVIFGLTIVASLAIIFTYLADVKFGTFGIFFIFVLAGVFDFVILKYVN